MRTELTREDMFVILDGGGTIWYSMPVLYEHYQAAFSYFGLLRLDEFETFFPFKEVTEISSLRSFNSRKNFPQALLAMYFCNIKPETILDSEKPEAYLHDLVFKSWNRCPCVCFKELSQKMGDFLVKALYNYDDSKYPLCANVKKGLEELKNQEYILTMITNRQKDSALAILRNLGVHEYFDHIEAPIDTNEPTTKPIGKILEKFNIDDDLRYKVKFIGDSNLDIASAKDFALSTIAVLTGMGSERVLHLEKPDVLKKDLLEVANYLTKQQM